MNAPNENAHTETDPFARDFSANLTSADRSDSADGMTVHGLLSLLLPGEALRVQERVNRSIATIRLENKRFQFNFRRRLAWIGGSVGIAAAIALAVFYVPSTSDSKAYAALESIRSSARLGGRTYSVRMEIEPQVQSKAVDGPRAQHLTRTGEFVMGSGGRWTLTMFGMMPPRALLDAQERRDGTRDGARDGADRRPPRPKAVFGFNGTTYWAVDSTGAIRTAASMRELRPPLVLGALDSGWSQSDEDIEPLTLESMLDRLDRGYEITFDRSSTASDRSSTASDRSSTASDRSSTASDRSSTASDRSSTAETATNRPVTVVTARASARAPTRATAQGQIGGPRIFGPKSVRIVADAQTFEVLRAQWEWVDTAMPLEQVQGGKPVGMAPMAGTPVTKRVFFDLIKNPKRDPGPQAQFDSTWFEPATHVEAVRKAQQPPNGAGHAPVPR